VRSAIKSRLRRTGLTCDESTARRSQAATSANSVPPIVPIYIRARLHIVGWDLEGVECSLAVSWEVDDRSPGWAAVGVAGSEPAADCVCDGRYCGDGIGDLAESHHEVPCGVMSRRRRAWFDPVDVEADIEPLFSEGRDEFVVLLPEQ
jgi:hypothetical protein